MPWQDILSHQRDRGKARSLHAGRRRGKARPVCGLLSLRREGRDDGPWWGLACHDGWPPSGASPPVGLHV